CGENVHDSRWTGAKMRPTLRCGHVEEVARIALVQLGVVRTSNVLRIVFLGETPKPVKRVWSKNGTGEAAQMLGKQVRRSGIALEYGGPCDAPLRGRRVRRRGGLLFDPPIEGGCLVGVEIHPIIVSREKERVIRPSAGGRARNRGFD